MDLRTREEMFEWLCHPRDDLDWDECVEFLLILITDLLIEIKGTYKMSDADMAKTLEEEVLRLQQNGFKLFKENVFPNYGSYENSIGENFSQWLKLYYHPYHWYAPVFYMLTQVLLDMFRQVFNRRKHERLFSVLPEIFCRNKYLESMKLIESEIRELTMDILVEDALSVVRDAVIEYQGSELETDIVIEDDLEGWSMSDLGEIIRKEVERLRWKYNAEIFTMNFPNGSYLYLNNIKTNIELWWEMRCKYEKNVFFRLWERDVELTEVVLDMIRQVSKWRNLPVVEIYMNEEL